MVDLACARGAVLREQTRALELHLTEGGVEVETDRESFLAPVAVVAAGAWARPLLAGAGIELPVTPSRESVAFFPMRGEWPVPVFVEWTQGPLYALPSPGQGLKTGWHHTGPDADPDADGPVESAVVDRMADWVAERFPGAEPHPHHAETCLYTNTEDESFVLERHGPIVVGSPCSGHGFKFAPLIGERLATLATER
jgi:sarcosine oxidase